MDGVCQPNNYPTSFDCAFGFVPDLEEAMMLLILDKHTIVVGIGFRRDVDLFKPDSCLRNL